MSDVGSDVEDPQEERSADAVHGRVHVLFVDPSADGSPLEDERDEIEVISVDDADSAIERLTAGPVDFVVSEYALPGSDGLALLEQVRSLDENLPFVLFTDSGDEGVASEAFSRGATGYLRKADGYAALADRVVDVAAGSPPPQARTDPFGLLGGQADQYGLFIVDADGRVVEWGAGARRLVGYPATEVRGESIEAFAPENEAEPALSEELLNRVADDDRGSGEGWFVRADGSRFWARASVHSLRRGDVLEGFGVVVSPLSGISAGAYETVSVEPFQLVGRVLPDGTVVDVNRTALEFGDIVREDVVGEPLWDATWWPVGDGERVRIREAVETGAKGSVVRFESRVRDDGEFVPVDFSIKPIVDERDGVVALIVEARDITERKGREEQLREQRAFVEGILSALPYMHVTVGSNGDILRWNDRFRDVTGYDESALAKRRLLDIVPDDEKQAVEGILSTVLEENEDASIETLFETADGERLPVEFVAAPFDDPDGDERGLVGIARDISEQRERERRLEAIFDQTFQFTGLLEPDGTIIEANDTALRFGGLSRDDVVGEKIWNAPWFQYEDAAARAREAVESARHGTFVRFEIDVQGADRVATIDFSLKPVTDETGEVVLLIPEGRDITKRKQRTEQLEELNEIAQDLTGAESEAAVCELAVDAAAETLGTSFVALDVYDESTGSLERRAETSGVGDLPAGTLFDHAHGKPWAAFADGAERVFEDPTDPLTSAAVLPLGQHGVLTAAVDSGEFGDADMDAARILAAHVEAALDRMDRERSLRERTETLERRTDQLERLNRLNEIIRGLVGALIEASGREEIESDICSELTDAGPYLFAWVGYRDPVSAEIRPEASAGDGGTYLEAVTITTNQQDDQDPAASAVQKRSTQVVNHISANPPLSPWRKQALEAGFHSVISVPLMHGDALYGVLNLYADEPGIFDDVEREVIEELGEIAGYAINAAERKEALLADRTVELDFRLQDSDAELFEFTQQAGDRLEMEGIVPTEEGPSRAFFTLEGGTAEGARRAAAEFPGLRNFRIVSSHPDDESFVFECIVQEGLVSTLLEHGAVPQTIVIKEEVRVVVELPSSRDVREFAEMFESKFEGATLVARRMRDRPIQTEAGFHEQLRTELTDRQYAAARTAYISGYFEWPRQSTGEDVAELLDITQPTFNRHLREAQRKLFDLLFESSNE